MKTNPTRTRFWNSVPFPGDLAACPRATRLVAASSLLMNQVGPRCPQTGGAGTQVAQICNLLYRRLAVGRCSECSCIPCGTGVLRNSIPRYSRLQICATSASAQNLQTFGCIIHRAGVRRSSFPRVFPMRGAVRTPSPYPRGVQGRNAQRTACRICSHV